MQMLQTRGGGGRLLSECDQRASNQGNMAFFDEQDVTRWDGPCEGPELRGRRF